MKQLWWFLDDEREPVPHSEREWVIFRTGEAMASALVRYGLPDGISFDHDLGQDIMTGHDVAKLILDMVMDESLTFPQSFIYVVHSQNPVGARNIAWTMDDAVRYTEWALDQADG